MNGGGVLGVDGLWDPQKMLTVQQERDLSQFSCSTGDKTEGFGLGEQREQKDLQVAYLIIIKYIFHLRLEVDNNIQQKFLSR